MRVAVTGGSGFVGRHVLAELESQEISALPVANGVRPSWLAEDAPFISCDLTRDWPGELGQVDAIIHLAGRSAVGLSFDQPQLYLADNGAMVTNMCEALVASGSRCRVLIVSSGAVYDAHQPQPIAESGRLAMSSPYVVSKVLVENIAQYYARRGLDLVIARPFNHAGPGQERGFLVPDLVAEARAAVDEGRPMRVGDLGTRRDYTDVRDVARAYRLLLGAELGSDPVAPVFNVCSGTARSGDEVRGLVLKGLGLDDLPVDVDPAKVRPTDAPTIAGDNTRLRSATGWSPRIEFTETVADSLR